MKTDLIINQDIYPDGFRFFTELSEGQEYLFLNQPDGVYCCRFRFLREENGQRIYEKDSKDETNS